MLVLDNRQCAWRIDLPAAVRVHWRRHQRLPCSTALELHFEHAVEFTKHNTEYQLDVQLSEWPDLIKLRPLFLKHHRPSDFLLLLPANHMCRGIVPWGKRPYGWYSWPGTVANVTVCDCEPREFVALFRRRLQQWRHHSSVVVWKWLRISELVLGWAVCREPIVRPHIQCWQWPVLGSNRHLTSWCANCHSKLQQHKRCHAVDAQRDGSWLILESAECRAEHRHFNTAADSAEPGLIADADVRRVMPCDASTPSPCSRRCAHQGSPCSAQLGSRWRQRLQPAGERWDWAMLVGSQVWGLVVRDGHLRASACLSNYDVHVPDVWQLDW